MSPTVFRHAGYRFYFFSREELRPHVHVHHADGEAKFWLEPKIELARSDGMSARRLTSAGFAGQQPPWDGFMGARYAVVTDPDGNSVGLMGPIDPARKSMPPEPEE